MAGNLPYVEFVTPAIGPVPTIVCTAHNPSQREASEGDRGWNQEKDESGDIAHSYARRACNFVSNRHQGTLQIDFSGDQVCSDGRVQGEQTLFQHRLQQIVRNGLIGCSGPF
jgi:hypothetical protein